MAAESEPGPKRNKTYKTYEYEFELNMSYCKNSRKAEGTQVIFVLSALSL
ncbi:hypothetical protein K280104A7_19550 [Candidatus Bariatricus faecipullorum]